MSHVAIRDYLRAAVGGDPTGTADAELLARFAQTRDETAFELLVWRHAALVQRSLPGCPSRPPRRRGRGASRVPRPGPEGPHVLRPRDRWSGGSIGSPGASPCGTAKDRARRAANSAGLDRVPDSTPAVDAAPDEVEALCAEVDRLPERYRIPVLLCFFEGLTHAEAARRTGWPVGSVAGRLARAKDLLARRLSRKGVGMASVALALPLGSFVGFHRAGSHGIRGQACGRSRCRTSSRQSGRRSHADHDRNHLETDRRERRGGICTAPEYGASPASDPSTAKPELVLVEQAAAGTAARRRATCSASSERRPGPAREEHEQPEADSARAAQLPRRERQHAARHHRQGRQADPQLARRHPAVHRTGHPLQELQAR